MKTILVPTDFSENADNALEYAIEVANAFGADIHLLHTFHLSNKAGMFVSVQERMRLDAIDDMKYLTKKTTKKLTADNNVEYHVIRDYAPEGVAYMANKIKADIIIMGTKGASGVKGAFWGSVASKVIANTSKPVLAVPGGYKDFKLKHVLLTIDNPTFDDKEVLAPLVTLTQRAKAKITTFNMAMPIKVDTDDDVLATSDTLVEISDEFFQSYDSNLKDGIMDYIKNHDADMVCMIRKDRGFLVDFMHTSATKKIIFDCPVPLLVLHQRDR